MVQLLACPLVSDESIWKQVDHAIVAVSGTCDLGLGDVQEMVSALKDRLPANIPIVTSASLDEESHEKVHDRSLRHHRPGADERPRNRRRGTVRLNGKTPSRRRHRAAACGNRGTETGAVSHGSPAQEKAGSEADGSAEPIPATVENVTVNEAELISAQVEEIEPEPSAPPPAPVPVRASRRFEARQEEMSFEGPPRGRFEKRTKRCIAAKISTSRPIVAGIEDQGVGDQ